MISLSKAIIYQTNNTTETESILQYMETIFEGLFITMSIITLLITPIILLYFAFSNYFKWKEHKKLLKKHIKIENEQSSVLNKIYTLYKKCYTKFLSNSAGLISWNIFSLVYIITSFSNFKTGILEYFLFPFKVLESYTTNFSMFSLYEFKEQGLSMLIIFMLTILFFVIGKKIATYLLKNKASSTFKNEIQTDQLEIEMKTSIAIN